MNWDGECGDWGTGGLGDWETGSILILAPMPYPLFHRTLCHHKNTAIALEGKNTAVKTIPVVGTGVRLVPK